MKGGKNKQPLGYTILEVMIVLAISGVMFLIAVQFINGKQEKVSFTEGVNTLSANLQDMIEQIVNGRYEDIPITCIAPAGSGTQLQLNYDPSSQGQGTNQDCVFLGKALYFYDQGNSTYSYATYTMAGTRSYISGFTPVAGQPITLSNLEVYQPISNGNDIKFTQRVNDPQNLKILGVDIVRADGTDLGDNFCSIALIQSLGIASDAAGDFQSGTQSVNLYYSPTLTPRTVNSTAYVKLSSWNTRPAGQGDPLLLAKSAAIYVTDGTQYAEIDIGLNNASQLSVDVNHNPGVHPAVCE